MTLSKLQGVICNISIIIHKIKISRCDNNIMHALMLIRMFKKQLFKMSDPFVMNLKQDSIGEDQNFNIIFINSKYNVFIFIKYQNLAIYYLH
jgi:hypothetical protein